MWSSKEDSLKVIEYNLQLKENREVHLLREHAHIYKKMERQEFTGDAPDRIYTFMCDNYQMHRLAEEHVYVLAFNTKQQLEGVCLIAKGTVNQTIVSPREIYIRALLMGAVTIVMVHNHPSGEPKLSKEDIFMTKKVREAGRILGVQLLDHILIGRDTFCSAVECGVL